jgi:hypothetical protein
MVFAILFGLLSSVYPFLAIAQPEQSEDFHSTRIGISAGMGVSYHAAQDIVDRINGSGVITQRVGDFKSGVDFFGAVSVPVSRDWAVKGEYVYMLSSYSLPSIISVHNAEFSYNIHMPTLVGQYILFEAPTYNLKAGVGAGYHFATYSEKYSSVDASFTGRGVGMLIELEGNTALGEALYAHLGVQMRWEFIGALTNGAGNPAPGNSASTSFNCFSIGARLGMTYYL